MLKHPLFGFQFYSDSQEYVLEKGHIKMNHPKANRLSLNGFKI